jgi:hypothetical protein
MFRAGNDGTNGNVFVTLALQDGSSIRLRQVEPADTGTSSQFFFGNANRGDFDAVVDSTVIFTDANSIMATIAKQENIRRTERASERDWRGPRRRVLGWGGRASATGRRVG